MSDFFTNKYWNPKYFAQRFFGTSANAVEGVLTPASARIIFVKKNITLAETIPISESSIAYSGQSLTVAQESGIILAPLETRVSFSGSSIALIEHIRLTPAAANISAAGHEAFIGSKLTIPSAEITIEGRQPSIIISIPVVNAEIGISGKDLTVASYGDVVIETGTGQIILSGNPVIVGAATTILPVSSAYVVSFNSSPPVLKGKVNKVKRYTYTHYIKNVRSKLYYGDDIDNISEDVLGPVGTPNPGANTALSYNDYRKKFLV